MNKFETKSVILVSDEIKEAIQSDLTKELEKEIKRREEAEKVIDFYADPENWYAEYISSNCIYQDDRYNVGGDLAREYKVKYKDEKC